MSKAVFLTPEQDAEFDGYMLKWQTVLGLNDWRVERNPKSAGKGAMAQVHTKLGARLASYQTGNWGSTPVTSRTLEETAVHELLHVLLADFAYAAKNCNDETALESVEHSVVNRLEKLLMGRAS
jgi:hypothetical protein